MDERRYNLLKYIAISMAVGLAVWIFYDKFILSTEPGELAYQSGVNYFADGHYEEALQAYQQALQEHPDYGPALRGRAETLIMLHRERDAIEVYDELIDLQPQNAGHYANRGIARDRLGQYEEALRDYQSALRLDPEVGEGPGWLTRFLRNQPEKLPGIAARATYLQAQLALPPSERLLRVPELDESQRPHKK